MAFVDGCDCDRGRCFNGVACIPQTCARHYTFEALHPELDTLAPKRAALRTEVEKLQSATAEEEPARAAALQEWLRAQHFEYQVNVLTKSGMTLEPNELAQHSATDLVVSLVVEVEGRSLVHEWTPQDTRSVLNVGFK